MFSEKYSPKPLCTLVFLCFVTTISFSQQAKTFLYKITGNGLEKPSYLYGTIHLRDSRLFNLQDSLYSYISQCDVFANEVEPDSMTGKIIDFQKRQKEQLTLGEQLDPAALARVKKKYQHLTETPVEKLTVLELLGSSEEYWNRQESSDKMVTFLDMYLMGLARDWGKQIKGLEKIEDQINLFDRLLDGQNPEEVLESAIGRNKLQNELIKAYLNTDMQVISRYVASLPPDLENIFLSDRNKKMLQSMEAIMPGASLFAAVGAAHLPGTQGLIQLLRDKGYTVTPELSPARTHARNYTAKGTGKQDTWVKTSVEKDGYEIWMPGVPSKNMVPDNGAEMYTYVDWQHGEQYLIMHMNSRVPFTRENTDSILGLVLKGVAEKGKQADKPEPITVNDFNGFQMTMLGNDKNFYRTCILQKDNEILMLMMGAPAKLTVSGSKAIRFINSLKSIPRITEPFARLADSLLAFSVSMPGNPVEKELGDESENIRIKQFFSKQGNQEFLTLVSFCKPGFGYQDDSATLNKFTENILNGADTLLYREQGKLDNAYPFTNLTCISKEEKKLQTRMIIRGNRVYMMYYLSGQESFRQEVSDSFFNSFTFLPYKEVNLNRLDLDSFTLVAPDTAYTFASSYGVMDSSVMHFYLKPYSSTFSVISKQVNPLWWGKNDSSFLHQLLIADIEDDAYKMEKLHYTLQAGMPSLDIEYKLPERHQTIKWRYLKAGNRVYQLSYQFEKSASGSYISAMFDSFSVVKKYPPFDVTQQSPQQVFATLDTSGAIGFTSIVEDFDGLPFTRDDLPMLFAQAAVKHAGDTAVYQGLEEAIWRKIEALTDCNDVNLFVSNWKQTDTAVQYQSKLLACLAKLDTRQSLEALKQLYPLMTERKPSTGSIGYALKRNKDVITSFFPAWYSLIQNVHLGPQVVYLHLLAKDSGWIDGDPEGYTSMLMQLGEKIIEYYGQGGEDSYLPYSDDVIVALGKLNTPETNAVLLRMANGFRYDDYLVFDAVKQLLDNGEKPVEPIHVLSAKPEWRSMMYSTLKEMNAIELFPVTYLTQEAMAESYLYEFIEDYSPDTLISIGYRKMKYAGKDYLFYLYKAGFEDEKGMEFYLAVSGPFKTDGKTIELPENISQVAGIVDEVFAKSKIEKQLREFIKGFENEEDLAPLEDVKLK